MRWMFASGIVVVAALLGSAFLAQSAAAQGCPSFPNGPYIWGGGGHGAVAAAGAGWHAQPAAALRRRADVARPL